MTSNSLTDIFLKGILSITQEDIHPDTIEKAKFCLLDYIGVTLAGSTVTHNKIERLRTLLDDQNTGNLAIGVGTKQSLQNAIFYNGINSHILELDDGSRFGVTHPGGPLFSALLPVAFKYNVEWYRLLLGILTGYETILRISTSIQPQHYNRGYHPTATCTPLGIAVGICVMLDLPFDIVKNAFSSACISAGGSLKAIEDTSQMKVINAARAAEMGFTSYCVGRAGFSGPEDALSGTSGFLSIMSSSFDEDILIRKKGERLWIERVYCKLYASCRHTHGAIEGMLQLRKLNIKKDDIVKIEIRIYKGVKGKHDIYDICGEESAKMSIPYSAAAAFMFGEANDKVFKKDYINNPIIHRFMNLTLIVEDDYLTSLLPHKRATQVSIQLCDGQIHSTLIEYPKGEPENPITLKDLKEKFNYLVEKSGKSEQFAKDIITEIFEEQPNLQYFGKFLSVY